MDIGTSIRNLGPVDMTALKEKILSFDDDVWREEDIRQKKFNDVHYDNK